jgi:hypothetical protein
LVGVVAGQQSFTPVADLAGVIEPPVERVPINAGQVITGVAQRYVIQMPPDAQHPQGWIGVQSATPGAGPVTELALPTGAQWAGAVAASDDGARVLGRLAYSNGTVRACIWDGATPAVWAVGTNAMQEPAGLSADGARMLLRIGQVPAVQTRVVSASQSLVVTAPADEEPPLQVYGQVLSPSGENVAGRYGFSSVFEWNAAGGTTLEQPPFTGRFDAAAASDNGRCSFVTYEDNSSLLTATWADGAWRSIPGFLSVCQRRDGAQIGGLVLPDNVARAAIWSPTTGQEDLRTALEARGIDVQGWILWDLRYISPDGSKLVGRGLAPGSEQLQWWVATITPYAAADIGKAGGVGGSDGMLDNNDFVVFISRFFAHDERADMGKRTGERGVDGVFDNDDFIAFISLFFNGEP